MKESDYNVIANMAGMILDENEYDLTAILGRERASFVLMVIYTTNNVCQGNGQVFYVSRLWNENTYVDQVSVISFENGVSVIVNSAKSSYQDRFPMCGYESLHDDLYQIAICIQAAFDRMQL